MSTEAFKSRGLFADAAFEFIKLTNEVSVGFREYCVLCSCLDLVVVAVVGLPLTFEVKGICLMWDNI